jgi:hypothetical protein
MQKMSGVTRGVGPVASRDDLVNAITPLHNLILRQTCGLGFHSVTGATWSLIFDEAQTKRATTILVAGELLNSSLSVLSGVESNYTGAARSTIWLVLNLSLFDLPDGCEELDQILIAG